MAHTKHHHGSPNNVLQMRFVSAIAQVALRFLLQQKIVVIPKSTHIERMKENFEALDFDLEAAEMREIEQLEIGKSLFGWW